MPEPHIYALEEPLRCGMVGCREGIQQRVYVDGQQIAVSCNRHREDMIVRMVKKWWPKADTE